MENKDKIFTSGVITQIQSAIDSDPTMSRQKLSRLVCQWLDWRSPNGSYKEVSCRIALLKLHRQGQIKLPESKQHPNLRTSDSEIKSDAFSDPPEIQCSLKELGRIFIVAVQIGDKSQSQRWNAMMERYHYLGAGSICGAQIRYFIESEQYGTLGGFAFSAAAWKVSARDNWIGWDSKHRPKRLNQVVNNSRFLILPQVNVKNLASHALGLAVNRLVGDWQERYAITPVLLETFIEHNRFKGSSYRAANWIYVGQTTGRGRQDRYNNSAVPVKDIYVYPLQKNAAASLSEGSVKASQTVVLKAIDWAEQEFVQAQLGDQRRVNRLVTIARDFYARPGGSIPLACQTRAKTKAAYRFFDEEETTLEKILAPHYKSTKQRIQPEKVVLAVQDTTTLNYNSHPATQNLGPIGAQKDGALGLIVHDTMAFNTLRTPLGLLDVQCWARDVNEFGKRKDRHDLPIFQKESNKWLKSFEAALKAQKECPNTMIVSVGDRESDIYELFDLALSDVNNPKLLVRAKFNRRLAEEQGHLWEYLQRQTASGVQQLFVPKKGKRQARTAELEIRFAKVTLKPPSRQRSRKELTVWAVLAQEINCPDYVKEPLEWMLLTTIEVNSFEQAIEKLRWYTIRWGIEVYHRTLKSGCKIEDRQLAHADRIESCLAIDMVVAWRIYHLTQLGRETPDVPCTVYFKEAEWKALLTFKYQTSNLPELPPSLRTFTRILASLGGFLGRKCDGEPGTKSLWIGFQRLDDITAMWKIMTNFYKLNPLSPCPVT
jgi:hypothetical protein